MLRGGRIIDRLKSFWETSHFLVKTSLLILLSAGVFSIGFTAAHPALADTLKGLLNSDNQETYDNQTKTEKDDSYEYAKRKAAATSAVTPTPSRNTTPTPTSTPTPSPSPTSSPTPTATPNPTSSPSPTPTPRTGTIAFSNDGCSVTANGSIGLTLVATLTDATSQTVNSQSATIPSAGSVSLSLGGEKDYMLSAELLDGSTLIASDSIMITADPGC